MFANTQSTAYREPAHTLTALYVARSRCIGVQILFATASQAVHVFVGAQFTISRSFTTDRTAFLAFVSCAYVLTCSVHHSWMRIDVIKSETKLNSINCLAKMKKRAFYVCAQLSASIKFIFEQIYLINIQYFFSSIRREESKRKNKQPAFSCNAIATL